MAEKHNNENAYIDYLDAITEKYNVKKDLGNYSTIDISKLEPKEKKQITNWLNKMLQNKIISQKELALRQKVWKRIILQDGIR